MKKKLKKTIIIVMSIITFMMFAFSISILIIGTNAFKENKVTSVFGYTYSFVPTNSMANPLEDDPIYPYELVIGDKVDFDTLKVGDTIIYFSEEYQINICHRIIKIEDGVITTKGTNNHYEDSEKTTKDNFVSKVIFHKNILNVGKVVTNNRQIIFLSLIIILIGVIISEVLNIIRMKLQVDKNKEAERETLRKEKLRKELQEEILRELQGK